MTSEPTLSAASGADTATFEKDAPCGRGCLVGRAPSIRLVLPGRCKRWTCERCRRVNARKLEQRLQRASASRFITLTLPFRVDADPHSQLDFLNASFRTLWKRVRRRFPGAEFGYVKIIEWTKKGTPHLHVATDCPYIPQRWVSEHWRQITGARVVDIRIIRESGRIAAYLAKYLTKEHAGITNRRRYSATKGFLPPFVAAPRDPEEPVLSWSHSSDAPPQIEAALAAAGYQLIGKYWVEIAPLEGRPSADPLSHPAWAHTRPNQRPP